MRLIERERVHMRDARMQDERSLRDERLCLPREPPRVRRARLCRAPVYICAKGNREALERRQEYIDPFYRVEPTKKQNSARKRRGRRRREKIGINACRHQAGIMKT